MYLYTYENLKKATECEDGKTFVDKIKEFYAEKYKDKPILELNYSYDKLYLQNGNRSKFEKMCFERRNRLACLVILAIADDSYLEPLEEIMSAICDEFTWVLPAHRLYDFGERGYKYNTIDLFSAETGFYLSEAVYVLGEKLTEDIKYRVKTSVKTKIVDIFENNTVAVDGVISNWSAVCSCGIGLSYLYLFPERFRLVKERILGGFRGYLKGIDEEGYCSEGMAYWQYGFGFFCWFFDIYKQLVGDDELLHLTKTKNLLLYPQRAYMQDNVYIPFADGGTSTFFCASDYCYAMKNLFGSDFNCQFNNNYNVREKSSHIRTLYGLWALGENKENTSEEKSFYFHKAQVWVYKTGNYAFAVKSGHNDEMHNHNDVGSFQIVKNGKRVLVDIGAGEYTRQYFNDPVARYGDEIFVCGSQSHSVPIIDGNKQRSGKQYCGKVLARGENFMEIDLSKAYDGDYTVIVKYTATERGVIIKYKVDNLSKDVVFRFVGEFPIYKNRDSVRVENVNIVGGVGASVHVWERKYPSHSAGEKNVYGVDYTYCQNTVEAEFFIDCSEK